MSSLLAEKINLLLKTGKFSSKKALIEKALSSLLASDLSLKTELATSLYERGVISLWKASEIAGLSLEELKEYLKSKNIKVVVGKSPKEESNKRILKILKSL